MLVALIAAVLATAVQASGGGVPPASPSGGTSPTGPSEEQRIAQASMLGGLIYTLDRAAWVSTDALTAKVPKDQLAAIGGYVVEATDVRTLRVTYYRGAAATAQAFFTADVRGGKVVDRELLAQPVPLTAKQAALARARAAAVRAAGERSYQPCTPLPFNTVMVPSRSGGPVAVYLLTAQQEARTYWMGGNYQLVINPDGRVLTARPYNKSCLSMSPPKLPPGATPVGMVVNHLLDPVPTELHVFASYSLRMPLFVSTPDKRMWKVTGNSITLAPAR